MAPEALTSHAKTCSGKKYEIRTEMYPTMVPARIAQIGTPRRVVVPGQGEEHPRGDVEAGVEHREHRRQDHEVHQRGGVGYPHLLQRDGEGAGYRARGE